MMLRGFFAIAIGSVLGAVPVFGGVIRHDVASSEYTTLATDSRYSGVGRITLQATDGLSYTASGTLVASNWVLTAGHVTSDATSMNFNLNGTTYAASKWVTHPSYDGSLSRGYDIALMQLSAPISGATVASVYTGTSEIGKVGTFVGYGQTGNGLTGSTTYDGVKRAGKNTIDVLFNTGGKTSRLFGSDFDNPNGTTRVMGSSTSLGLEYAISFGDSGGGVFIEDAGKTWLAGVHSFGVDYNLNGLSSDYGDYTGHVRVSSFAKWISDTIGGTSGGGGGKGGGKPPRGTSLEAAFDLQAIPEPTSVGAVLMLAGALLSRRRG